MADACLVGTDEKISQWLAEAGLVRPEDARGTGRIVIDIPIDGPVRIYIERFLTGKMLSVKPPDLSGAEITIV